MATPLAGEMCYESTAEPIKIGYLMDFLLSDDYPQDRRAEGVNSHLVDRFGEE
jgi:hypothetical protein